MTYKKQPVPKLVAEKIIKRGKAKKMYRKGHDWFVTWSKGDRKMKGFIIENNFRILV